MKFAGAVHRSRPLFGAALAVGILLVGGSQAAAGQLDASGVTVNWDDSNLGAAPNGEGCREFLFPWRNNGPDALSIIRLVLTSASGVSAEDSKVGPSGGVVPGDSGNFVISACIRDGFQPGTQVSVQLTTTDSQRVSTQSRVSTFTMGPSPTQGMVSVTKAPCTPTNGTDFNAKFCKGGNVLMLKDSSLWILGTDSDSLTVYNENGVVPMKESFRFELNPTPNAKAGTAFFRLDGTKFKPGKYVVIATGSESESWKCKVSGIRNPVLTCRWDPGFSAISGYSFKWNGQQVTNVKKASRSALKRYRL